MCSVGRLLLNAFWIEFRLPVTSEAMLNASPDMLEKFDDRVDSMLDDADSVEPKASLTSSVFVFEFFPHISKIVVRFLKAPLSVLSNDSPEDAAALNAEFTESSIVLVFSKNFDIVPSLFLIEFVNLSTSTPPLAKVEIICWAFLAPKTSWIVFPVFPISVFRVLNGSVELAMISTASCHAPPRSSVSPARFLTIFWTAVVAVETSPPASLYASIKPIAS